MTLEFIRSLKCICVRAQTFETREKFYQMILSFNIIYKKEHINKRYKIHNYGILQHFIGQFCEIFNSSNTPTYVNILSTVRLYLKIMLCSV